MVERDGGAGEWRLASAPRRSPAGFVGKLRRCLESHGGKGIILCGSRCVGSVKGENKCQIYLGK